MDSFNQLKELVQKNPDVLKLLQQPEPQIKTKKSKIIPGQTIEIPQTSHAVEEGIPISMAQAKQLLKKQRKPRTLSDESKAKMLANLQKGREALKLKKEQMINQAKKTIAAQVKPPVTKFVVKQPTVKPKKTKAVVVEDVMTDDESIEVQLERNEALLRKVQQMQQQAMNERVAAPPQLKRQKRFSLFY
jgi:hypothetical protein